jgi:hypothetical protein
VRSDGCAGKAMKLMVVNYESSVACFFVHEYDLTVPTKIDEQGIDQMLEIMQVMFAVKVPGSAIISRCSQ